MTRTDDTLDNAITLEERDLLRRIGDDAGHVDQALSLFRGRSGWVSVVLLATQAAMFVAGLMMGWRFFQADDALTALHWGLPAAVLLIMALMLKLALWPAMHANRILLALKRLELLTARKDAV